jgi:diadenosine tetraphosphate (Ap4A) HIT family hydrolase
MPVIFETDKYVVVGHEQPHHDRNNGGHAKVSPKKKYSDRTKMPMDLYVGLMQLVTITGEAITNVMRSKGVDVVRINYQDNGNWSYFPDMKKEPHIHIHLYVRSNNEVHPITDKRFKSFPNALYFPYRGDVPEYYESFQPYSKEDCVDFRIEIKRLLETQKYKEVKERFCNKLL